MVQWQMNTVLMCTNPITMVSCIPDKVELVNFVSWCKHFLIIKHRVIRLLNDEWGLKRWLSPEDPSSVLSTYAGQLIANYNSKSRRSNALFWRPWILILMFTYTQRDTHAKHNKNNFSKNKMNEKLGEMKIRLVGVYYKCIRGSKRI